MTLAFKELRATSNKFAPKSKRSNTAFIKMMCMKLEKTEGDRSKMCTRMNKNEAERGNNDISAHGNPESLRMTLLNNIFIAINSNAT